MDIKTNLLIIGAGPFGLALAAYAKDLGMDFVIAGRPMEFWKKNMPEGMYLRSASDWSLDPTGKASIMNYLAKLGKTPEEVEPISRDFYLEYCQWFQEQHGIQSLPFYVTKLEKTNGHFTAELENGNVIEADQVVVAIGMGYFKNQPSELTATLPKGRYSHTCDAVDFKGQKGKRVLILGGRQSAFEWAALLNDEGAAEVHLSHRHESPKFTASDWSWVSPMVDGMVSNPAWFRNLPQEEQTAITKRMWGEGRLKVEPWLEERVMKPNTHIHEKAGLASCIELSDGALEIKLDNGDSFDVDDVILATGYKVDVNQIPFINGSLLEGISARNGFPVLDENFQTSVKGLYFTSMPAGQDFGPFFGFTISVRASAKIIGNALAGK